MDCQTALELLEVVRPDSDDLQQPELSDARHHLQSCERCRSVFRKRQETDRRIGQAMQSVAIPDVLRERLLSNVVAVASEPSIRDSQTPDAKTIAVSDTDPDGAGTRSTQPVRRHWLTAVAVMATCLLLGVVAWQVRWRLMEGPAISLDVVRRSVPHDRLSKLPPFAGQFKASLPSGWRIHRGLFDYEPPRAWHLDEETKTTAAIYRFRYRRRPAFELALVVIPQSQIRDVPAATTFGLADVVYGQSPAGQVATAAWVEDDLVYVCSVRGGAERLETLQRFLAIPTT